MGEIGTIGMTNVLNNHNIMPGSMGRRKIERERERGGGGHSHTKDARMVGLYPETLTFGGTIFCPQKSTLRGTDFSYMPTLDKTHHVTGGCDQFC